MAVSAMPIVRAQLETFYAICRILEQPGSLVIYLKDGWKRQYIRHLLMRQEYANLPRVSEELQMASKKLELFRVASGVTEQEKLTVNHEELGVPMPAGVKGQPISQFPTPGQVISSTQDPELKALLTRLYPEYQFLCGFVHLSPATPVLAAAFDSRHVAAHFLSSNQKHDIFQKEVAGPALWIDLVAVVQGCTELLTVYRSDVEFARVIVEAWNFLNKASLLAKSVWALRARRLLGVI